MLYHIALLTLLIFPKIFCEEDPIHVEKCPNSNTTDTKCQRYCMFWKDQLIDEIVCPPKFHYSPENETCVSSGEFSCSETDDNSKKVNYGSCIGKCPTSYDAADIFYLAHEDCKKYCICGYGQMIEMACDEDKNFSTLDNKCIHPSEADMKCPEIRQEFVPEETVEDITDFKDCLGHCNQNSSDITEDSQISAHRTPTKFCICRNGNFLVYDCPENEVFVEENKRCRNPEDPQKLRAHGNGSKIQEKPQSFKNDQNQCTEADKVNTQTKITETNTTESKFLSEEERKSLGNEETIIETVIIKKIKKTDDEIITTIFNTTTTKIVTVVTSVTPISNDSDSSAQCRHLIELLQKKKL